MIRLNIKAGIKNFLKRFLPVDYVKMMLAFHYDAKRYVSYSAAFKPYSIAAMEAKIILHYHILEKGITMPQRHMPFGVKIAMELVGSIREYEKAFGLTSQVEHGISVLKEYLAIHKSAGVTMSEFSNIEQFLDDHSSVATSKQLHYSKSDYYSINSKTFPEFAAGRHTIRNYTKMPVSDSKIKEAVRIASTAPSACNRQHVRVHCINDQKICKRILELQGGNRGFGDLSDKVLVLSIDLREEVAGIRERYDAYLNGGIFLMNLCYALTYCEVAHCILTGSLEREKDTEIRALAKVPENEVIGALLCCGEAADEFDVARSPKRDVDEILTFVGDR